MKLLRENDVRDAILNEQEATGIINDNNRWYYRGRIDISYGEAYKLIKNVKQPVYSDYSNLFKSVKLYSFNSSKISGKLHVAV